MVTAEKSAPSARPNLPACVCRMPCSLQHPKIGLFQKMSAGFLTAPAILYKLSPDYTAGTLALCPSSHRCHRQETERQRQSFCAASFLMKEHLLRHLCALTIPSDQLRRAERGCQIRVVPWTHAATSWIKMIKKEAAHHTFDDSVNKKSCFFPSMWARAAAEAQALRTYVPKLGH